MDTYSKDREGGNEAPEILKKFKTGIAVVDELLKDGFPFSASVLIMGKPGTGKTILCKQLICRAVLEGRFGIYIALDDFPYSIRKIMLTLGYNVKDYESQCRLLFIDGYSSQAGVESCEKYFEDPRNLVNLSVLISKALEEAKHKSAIIVLDSLTTLIQRCDARPSTEFLRALIAKTRAYNTGSIIKLQNRAFHPAIVARVEDLVDGVIETKIEEKEEGLQRYIRITKMKGVRHSTNWLPYEMHPEQGIINNQIHEDMLSR